MQLGRRMPIPKARIRRQEDGLESVLAGYGPTATKLAVQRRRHVAVPGWRDPLVANRSLPCCVNRARKVTWQRMEESARRGEGD